VSGAGRRPATWWTLGVVAAVALTCSTGGAVATLPAGGPAAVASCTVSPSTVEGGDAVTLDASASQDASIVEFDVEGDGTYDRQDSTDFVITVSYSSAGTYQPTVRARNGSTDTSGCGTVTVEANDPPDAALTVDPDPVEPGQSVTLDASESSDPDGSIVEYRWDLDGDGTVDTTTGSPTTSTSFSQAGDHDVAVTVVDGEGATDAGTTTVTVRANRPPSAALTGSPSTAETGETVSLDAGGSTDSDGSISEYRWDLDGDGTVERTTSAPTASTSFGQSGEYDVAVTVVDDDGATDVATWTVTVAANEPPVVSLAASPAPAVPGQTVQLDASGSSDPDGSIVTYRWDTDGDASVERTTSGALVSTQYGQSGTYAVSVTVEDDEGATATTVHELAVRSPAASCEADPTTVGPTEAVTLEASGSPSPDTVDFDVDGDGAFDVTGQSSRTHTTSYDQAGTYEPRVRVHVGGQSATATCDALSVDAGGDGAATTAADDDGAAAITLNQATTTTADHDTTRTATTARGEDEGEAGLPLAPVGVVGALVAVLAALWYVRDGTDGEE